MNTCILNDKCYLNNNNTKLLLKTLNGLKKNVNNKAVQNNVNYNNGISNITTNLNYLSKNQNLGKNSKTNVLSNNRKYLILDLLKVEKFLENDYKNLETHFSKKMRTEIFNQDIAELLLYPIYLEYKEMVDYLKSSSNKVNYMNRWKSLKQIKKLQLIIQKIYKETILSRYYLRDYIVTRSICGKRCKLNPQPSTTIPLFDKEYLNDKYLSGGLGNPFPNFLDLRYESNNSLNDPKSMSGNNVLGKLDCSIFVNGKTKIPGMFGQKNSPQYNSCKVEIGATVKRGSGKKPLTKKSTTKKSTTKKPVTKKTKTKKTKTKKTVTKKPVTKKPVTKKPVTKKTVKKTVKKSTTKK